MDRCVEEVRGEGDEVVSKRSKDDKVLRELRSEGPIRRLTCL